MERARNWCFTYNNYPTDSHFDAESFPSTYVIVGRETGESGTPHYQGVICFKNMKAFEQVKAVLWPGVHIEAMKGTLEQAINYCKKDGDFYEYGVRPKTPKDKGALEKERWTIALQEARATGVVSDPQLMFVHAKTVKFLYQQEMVKRPRTDTDLKMLWYYGPAGTGKSRKAREDYPEAYLKMCNKWWDGYEDQEVVLIEDFDKAHHVLGHHLKIWGDRYPYLMEVKGSAYKIRPRLIIVTSNWHPRDIWCDDHTLEPILRRFTVVEFHGMWAEDQSTGHTQAMDSPMEIPSTQSQE